MVNTFSETDGAILNGALEVFSRKGYVDATVNAVARSAGVNSLTVFRHFKDKENLFRAVVERHANPTLGDGRLHAAMANASPLAGLAELAHVFFETIFRNIHILRIFIMESGHFPFVREKAWFVSPVLLGHFSAYLAALPLNAGMPPAETSLLAEMFVAHVTRRALEYNKHDNIWEYSPGLAEDFDAKIRPQISCLLDAMSARRDARQNPPLNDRQATGTAPRRATAKRPARAGGKT